MKTHFLDGPAAGEELEIERTPIFLRVTHNGITFEALDQENHQPSLTDIVYIYLRQGRRGSATYRLHTLNARDVFVMENYCWRGWVSRQPEAQVNHHSHA
jgi:hypothetical protein